MTLKLKNQINLITFIFDLDKFQNLAQNSLFIFYDSLLCSPYTFYASSTFSALLFELSLSTYNKPYYFSSLYILSFKKEELMKKIN